MKVLKSLFFIAITFGCLAACEKNETPTATIIDKFGEVVSLKVGESTEINGPNFVLSFDKVIEDSRCPNGAECFWEGQADINLLINNAQAIEVILRAGHEELAKDTLDGIVFTLIDVTPYPDLKEILPIPTESYVIDIQIDKL